MAYIDLIPRVISWGPLSKYRGLVRDALPPPPPPAFVILVEPAFVILLKDHHGVADSRSLAVRLCIYKRPNVNPVELHSVK